MGFRAPIKNWLERRKIQNWAELEERQIYHRILKSQLAITKHSLRERRRNEMIERRLRKRKPKRYIC